MIELIRRFYEAIANKGVVKVSDEEPPITHTKVFHKSHPRFERIKLPEIERGQSQLETLLELRKSTREFSNRQLTMEELAKVLGSCRIVDFEREPEKRTYPSGGARFPVEIYLAAYNVAGLDNGAYHYNLLDQSLELLLRQDLQARKRELISPFLENPAATIIFTSVLVRAAVKYGARAYPYSLIEAGHMGQNIELACAEEGIGCCSISGFVDSSVKEILDLTDDEIPIYTISLGWEKR